MKRVARRLLSLGLLASLLLALIVFAPAAFAAEGEPEAEPQETESAAQQSEAPAPAADAVELKKVTTTLDHAPTAMMSVSECHAAVSSNNASLVSVTWYGPNGVLSAGDIFESGNYRIEIRVMANDGYRFSTTDFNGYLNNSSATATVDGGGRYATISRSYEAYIYNPVIYKHPGAETVNEGGFVSYVATAGFAKRLDWELVSPDGQKVVKIGDLATVFPSSRAESNGTDKLNIFNVTAEMDGWEVRAVFYGYTDDYVTRSRSVTIRVSGVTPKPAETPAPSESPAPVESAAPTESPAPTESAAPAESAAPVESAAPTAAPDTHEHSFYWNYDEAKHWRECACGAHEQEEEHSFVWTEVSRDGKLVKEEGVCSVCGYTAVREESRNDANIVSSIPAGLVFGGIGGLVILLIAVENHKKRKMKRGRKRR